MQRPHDQRDDTRIVENLRRTIELTELGLALRASVLQHDYPHDDSWAEVMRDVRRAKEQAWHRNLS